MKFLSLFSGIGGLDLGLEWAGMECVGQVESDPWCRAWLAARWPGVPQWGDVEALPLGDLPEFDLLCGGFPCQDVSVAGLGAGLEGERSGLWRCMHDVVVALRPRWVLVENVPGLRNRGLDRVLLELERAGYAGTVVDLGAEDLGAPHRRRRLFIVGRRVGLADAGSVQSQLGRVAGDVAGAPRGAEGQGHQREWGRDAAGDRGADQLADAASGGREQCGPGAGAEGAGHRRQPDGRSSILADPVRGGSRGRGAASESDRPQVAGAGLAQPEPEGRGGRVAVGLANPDGERRERERLKEHAGLGGASRRVADGRGEGRRRDGAPAASSEQRGGQPALADSERARLEGQRPDAGRAPQPEPRHARAPARWPARPGQQQHDWESPRLCSIAGPGMGVSVDGIPGRVARSFRRAALRALGNAVSPPCAEAVGRGILAADARLSAGES